MCFANPAGKFLTCDEVQARYEACTRSFSVDQMTLLRYRELYTDLERRKLAELSAQQGRDKQHIWRIFSADGSDLGQAKAQLASGLHSLLTVTVSGRKRVAHVSLIG